MTIAVVPFKRENAKKRLSGMMSRAEREEFITIMLNDVVNTLLQSEADRVMVLSRTPAGTEHMPQEVEVMLSDKDLNGSINEDLLPTVGEPLIIVMADMPLLKAQNINDVLRMDGDIVLCPGRKGGTNLMYLREPKKFRTAYHGLSFMEHLRRAQEMGMKTEIYDSFYVSADIDEEEDLVELLLHGKGSGSREYLERRGFRLRTENGYVGVERV